MKVKIAILILGCLPVLAAQENAAEKPLDLAKKFLLQRTEDPYTFRKTLEFKQHRIVSDEQERLTDYWASYPQFRFPSPQATRRLNELIEADVLQRLRLSDQFDPSMRFTTKKREVQGAEVADRCVVTLRTSRHVSYFCTTGYNAEGAAHPGADSRARMIEVTGDSARRLELKDLLREAVTVERLEPLLREYWSVDGPSQERAIDEQTREQLIARMLKNCYFSDQGLVCATFEWNTFFRATMPLSRLSGLLNPEIIAAVSEPPTRPAQGFRLRHIISEPYALDEIVIEGDRITYTRDDGRTCPSRFGPQVCWSEETLVTTTRQLTEKESQLLRKPTAAALRALDKPVYGEEHDDFTADFWFDIRLDGQERRIVFRKWMDAPMPAELAKLREVMRGMACRNTKCPQRDRGAFAQQ